MLDTRRRQFLTLLGGAAAAWPVATRAQPVERMRRIGMLMNLAEDDPETRARRIAFLQALQELGWSEGRNIRIDYRWGVGDTNRHRANAAELVALAPDVILAHGSPILRPLQRASRTVPIVFVMVADPVGGGFVASLARPGGNATGFTNLEYGLGGKWLELLKQIAPQVTRAAVLRDAAQVSGGGQLGALQAVAPSFGVELRPIDVHDTGGIERTIAGIRAPAEWRLGRDGERTGADSPRRDHCPGSPPSIARGLPLPPVRYRRRPDLLRPRHGRSVPACGRLRRSHPQGREAFRVARAGADQVRAGDQLEDRQGARH
jgi:ABC transporter substrate binding protein